MTFMTFGEVTYGTLLEAMVPGDVGTAFSEAFQRDLEQLYWI